LFILNLIPKVKQLIIQHFISKSCNVRESPSNAEDWRNGGMVGCPITTTCPATHHSPSASFWWVKTLLSLQPTYSLDLSLCDFWLFLRCKRNDERKWFYMIENIISNMTHCLQVISKEDFQKCFQQWQECWNKCKCVCVCVLDRRTLKWINDKTGIQSFTKLFDQALYLRTFKIKLQSA
jgi:hypothetical protein